MDEAEILKLLKQLEPKMEKVLFQTSFEYREDLEQDLKEKVLKIINNKVTQEVPGFFEMNRR